jgi:adenine/guanine phosphoribosyltransferase-like PRPP-binding protein
VDDVIASGGHLRAAAAFLRDSGADVIAAVCAGRADEAAANDVEPFTMRTDVLPDFVSDPDWLLPEVYDGVEL